MRRGLSGRLGVLDRPLEPVISARARGLDTNSWKLPVGQITWRTQREKWLRRSLFLVSLRCAQNEERQQWFARCISGLRLLNGG